MALVFLSVGSNIEPDRHLRECHAALSSRYAEVAWSPVYRSPPVGLDGADFLNAVIRLLTVEPVASLQAWCKHLERKTGRTPNADRFASRTLDLDILLYGDSISTRDGLQLPRQEITEQAFVLLPLADIAGELHHPVHRQSYDTLLDTMRNKNPESVAALQRYPLFSRNEVATTTSAHRPRR